MTAGPPPASNTLGIRIRIAAPADVPSLFDVRTSVRENHQSVEELARIGVTQETVATMLSGEGRGWVAEEHGRIVAFSMADAVQATIFAMFVQPGYEGKGLGRALMDEAEQWLFARGCDEIWLLTDRNPLVRANGFYQHLGWRNDGVQEDGQVRYTKRPSKGDSVPGRAAESARMIAPIPDGWHSITPRLVVHDPAKLVAFLRQAFDATGDVRTDMPSVIRIGDSLVMVSGVGPREPMPAFLYVYVADSDATYQRALKAGAISLEEPQDLPYGDRRGMVQDPFGNVWQIATHKSETRES